MFTDGDYLIYFPCFDTLGKVTLWCPGVFSTDGQVYTWGQNSRGQLGLETSGLDVKTPQHVRSVSAVPLVQIAAGGEQSFAVSFSGCVFAWGGNDCGQLGLGDRTGHYMLHLYKHNLFL